MNEPFDFQANVNAATGNYSTNATFDTSKWVLIRQHHTHSYDHDAGYFKKKKKNGDDRKSIRDLLMDSF